MTETPDPKPKDIKDLTHDEYRERYVPKFPDGKKWQTMSPEERKIFVRESVALNEKKGYDEARSFAGRWDDTPEWEKLTETQRENIRAEQKRHAQAMQEFGATLAAKP